MTFIMTYGRFCLNKLPFQISSALEHFHRQMSWDEMSMILEGQAGALCHVDDVLVLAPTQQEHDTRLHASLAKI